MAKKTHYELILDLKADITSLKKDLGAATAQINSFGVTANRIADNFRMTFARGLKQGFAIFAGGELLNMTKRLARGMWDLAKEGNKAADIVENFERLGGSADSIRRAQDAVLGTVSAFDLMKVANEGLLRGLPNLNNNFALLVDYAGRFAQASGKELLPTIQGLTDALGKGSARALKEFGIFVQDGAGKSEVFSQALAQISQQMTVLAPMTRDVGTAQEELTTAIKDAVTQIGMGITASDSLAGSFHEMAVSVREVDWKDVGQSFAEIATNIMDIGQSIASVMPSLNRFAELLRLVTGRTTEADGANYALAEINKQIGGADKMLAYIESQRGPNNSALVEKRLAETRAYRDDLLLRARLLSTVSNSGSMVGPNDVAAAKGEQRLLQLNDTLASLQRKKTEMLSAGISNVEVVDSEINKTRELIAAKQEELKAIKQIKTEQTPEQKTEKTSPFAPAAPSSPSSTDLAFANKQVSDLKAQVRAAIEQRDTGVFETLKGNLRTALEDAYIQSNQKFVEAGLLSNAQLKDDAIRAANAEISHYDQQMNGANQRVAAGFGKAVAEIGRAQVEVIQNDLARAVDSLDFNRFQQLIPQLQAAEERAFVEANKAWVDDRLMSMEELNNRAKVHAIEQVETWYDKISERERQFAENLLQAHQDAVNTYNALFSNILNGGFSDWRQNLKDLAAGFLAEIAAGLGGALDPRLTNANGIGQVIGEGITSALGDFFGSLQSPGSQPANYYGANTPSGAGGSNSFFQQLGSVFGSFFGSSGNPTTDQAHNIGIQGPGLANGSFGSSVSQTDMAHAQGIQGPGMADGSFSSGGQEGGYGGYIQAATQIIGDIVSARDRDKQSKSNQGTGAAVGGGIGAIIGGIFGGPGGAAVGATIGSIAGGTAGSFFKWGPQNKETIARHQFANFLEDFFQKNNGLIVYDKNNQNPTRMTNFLEGGTGRFNDGSWADEMNAQGLEVSRTFRGLGEAFKDILGLTEDVGAQLGYLLGENLKYNVNNARHLVKRLGLNMEDLIDKLVEGGLKGERTWLEVESDIQGVNEAFKDGLVEVGAFDLAFKNLVNSGARGFEAVQAIRDIGVEAGEANIKTFDQLRALLLKTYDPATVDAFFQALKQRGITNLDQLAKLDNRTAGGIVADMQALGANFNDGANEVSKTMADAGKEITDNSSATRENSYYLKKNTEALSGGKVQAPANPTTQEDPEQAFASGGVVLGPTVSLMGEAGPEAILPLTRVNGKLGVRYQGGSGGGLTAVYHIDARGAAPGTERRIRAAIEEAQERASRRSAKAMQKTGAEAL